MAHFYSSVSSKGTTHTKCGNKDGMEAHVRGWDIGCRVSLRHRDGKDYISIYKTSGSNGSGNSRLLYEGEVEA